MGVPPRRAMVSRKAVEDAYGHNCVAEMPSGRPTEILGTPWGTEILVIHDPCPRALARLAGPIPSVRFWLSPCGDHAVAWTAGDVAHFQLFCGLMDRGWHQGRIDLGDGPPVVTVQDHAAAALLSGGAAQRMAGSPYRVRTGLRELRSDDGLPETSPGAGMAS
jgi:hypothetical protein